VVALVTIVVTTKVSDPHSFDMDPDPAFNANIDPDPWF
jgi:hypothetical protein